MSNISPSKKKKLFACKIFCSNFNIQSSESTFSTFSCYFVLKMKWVGNVRPELVQQMFKTFKGSVGQLN